MSDNIEFLIWWDSEGQKMIPDSYEVGLMNAIKDACECAFYANKRINITKRIDSLERRILELENKNLLSKPWQPNQTMSCQGSTCYFRPDQVIDPPKFP